MKENYRINWIDTSKAIGIFFVVLGHQSIPVVFENWIYSFHMPLFFFLSGFVYKENTLTIRELVRNKIKSLIIPYLFIAFSTYLFWFFIGRKYGSDSILNISPLKPLIGIFYSNGVNNWLVFNTPIWFITCLFCVEMSYDFLYKRLKNKSFKIYSLILSILIGYFLIEINVPRLPWGINVAFFAIVFYGSGNLLQNTNILKYFSNIKSPLLLLFFSVVFLSSNFLIGQFNGRVDMNSNFYGNILLFYLTAFLGIGGVLSLSSVFENNKLFLYYGKRTLIILGFQGVTISVIKAIQLFVFKIALEVLEKKLFFRNCIFYLDFITINSSVYSFRKIFSISHRKKNTKIDCNQKFKQIHL